MAKASHRTTDLLRVKILEGPWSPGERLGEVELAELLGVSRTPVREALTRLAAEGLVEMLPNKGARVAIWSDARLNEIFDLRLLLEPTATGKAVGRLTDSEIDELEELAIRMQRHGEPGGDRDFSAIATLNRQFHATLIDKSDSAQLQATLTSVRHISLATRNYQRYTDDSLSRSLSHHFEIVAAVRAGNSAWVESVMQCHLHNARTAMLGSTEVLSQGPETVSMASVLS